MLALPETASVDVMVWWANHRVMVLSGFAFVPAERPIGLAIAAGGETVLFVPLKSSAEVALIRESARWAGLAHRYLQDLTRVGLSETEVEDEAASRANHELLAAYDGAYRPMSWGRSGPHANYRGQIGAHGALPHSLTTNAVFQPGDTLFTGASCPMFGYWSELERTMVLGEPSAEQRRWFAHMLALQDLAIDACRPGRDCASVPGLGGFRHSDTILVTDGEPEFLTDYPRDLESLTLPVG